MVQSASMVLILVTSQWRWCLMHIWPSMRNMSTGCCPTNRTIWLQSKSLLQHLVNGRSPCSSHFPRKAILNSVQITEQLLLSTTQARSSFGSYWKESEWRPKWKLQMNRRDSNKEGRQEIKSRISEYWCTRHVSTNNYSTPWVKKNKTPNSCP